MRTLDIIAKLRNERWAADSAPQHALERLEAIHKAFASYKGQKVFGVDRVPFKSLARAIEGE